jgi:hypothetical protein
MDKKYYDYDLENEYYEEVELWINTI